MKPPIVLHSALTPMALADALRRSIDEERRTIFSLSGYRGSRPVLGEVTVSTFRLQKRRYWHNDFAPRFYAEFHPEAGGTRIEARFDFSSYVRTFMWIWPVGVALIGGPIFIAALRDFFTGSHHISGDVRAGLFVPPALAAWGFILPQIGRLLGRGEERFLLDFVQHTLAAQIEQSAGVRT